MAEQLDCQLVPGLDGQGPSRKRGRPPIVVTEEVLEQRRLSKQRVNAQRPESVDGQGPARKRGRPPIVVTNEVLEQRRLLRQRVNAQKAIDPARAASVALKVAANLVRLLSYNNKNTCEVLQLLARVTFVDSLIRHERKE